ncbi:hypothetical protein AMTRI_Chr08g209140 [Amborella trichopoda]|uniref:Uncharacterized protein n=1 Tax=Amborella trichopoda TaxID=13333 RepID=W1PCF0_AMBTC|nr:hypothetical protein AMTR_s00007p00213110 [Amborella trichopoda]
MAKLGHLLPTFLFLFFLILHGSNARLPDDSIKPENLASMDRARNFAPSILLGNHARSFAPPILPGNRVGQVKGRAVLPENQEGQNFPWKFGKMVFLPKSPTPPSGPSQGHN